MKIQNEKGIKDVIKELDKNDFDAKLESLIPKDHFYDGHPKLKALLLLLEAYCEENGYSYEMDSNVVTASSTYACVVTNLNVFHVSKGIDYNHHVRGMTGCGECSLDNMEEPYNLFPAAIAQTRSIVRAIRLFFGITKCASDELGPKKSRQRVENEEVVEEDNGKANAIYNVIKKMAAAKNADLNEISKKNFSKEFEDLEMQEMQKLLNMLKG